MKAISWLIPTPDIPDFGVGEFDDFERGILLNKQSNDEYTLETWIDFTNQNEIMIHSDSILTLVDPTSDLLKKYIDLIK